MVNFKHRKKALAIAAGSLAGILIVSLVGFLAFQLFGNHTVEVYAVSSLATPSEWMGGSSMSGELISDYSQEVYVDSGEDALLIKKVYVKEGDTVQKGDPLLEYDVSLLKLQMEQKDHLLSAAQTHLELLEHQLQLMKAGKPIQTEAAAASATPLVRLLSQILPPATESSESESSEAESSEPESSEAESSEPESSEPESSEPESSEPESSEPESSEPESEPEKPPKQPEILLNEKTPLYDGKGTKESPYRYLSDTLAVDFQFIDSWMRYADAYGDTVVRIEKHQQNDVQKPLFYAVNILFGKEGKFEFQFENHLDEPVEEPVVPPVDGGGDGGGGLFPIDPGPNYSQSELAAKEAEITKQKLDIQLAQIEYQSLALKCDQNIDSSKIDGTVSKVGKEGDAPYLVVSANDAIYIRATIDEFSYQTLTVGDTVLLNDWQTGGQCEAKVVEVSQYPSDQSGWSDKNPNVSYYWFVAEAPLSEDLSFQYGADVSIPKTANTFYLSKAYLTTENGRYYAYISGEDSVLHKVEVTTGATQYSMIEIVDGFTMEDNIALPFGKEVREGAPTVLSEQQGGW